MKEVVATYDYYTLDQAREIIYAEMRHDRLVREYWHKQQARIKRYEYVQKIKKLIAVLFFAAIVVAVTWIAEDITLILAVAIGSLHYMVLKIYKIIVPDAEQEDDDDR